MEPCILPFGVSIVFYEGDTLILTRMLHSFSPSDLKNIGELGIRGRNHAADASGRMTLKSRVSST